VDRIEGDIAVCECLESGDSLSVDVALLPVGTKEGDVLVRDVDGFVLDSEQTEGRRRRLSNRLNRLFDKGR